MSIDTQLFFVLNSFAGKSAWLDAVFIFGATGFLFLLWLLFLVMVVREYALSHISFASLWNMITSRLNSKRFNIRLLSAVFGSSISAYIISQLIGIFYFRPRPFVVLSGVVQLVERSPFDKSFPSDHATLAFALAWIVFFYNKKWGILFLVIAAIIALSRIITGVHYPFDVFAGALVALVVSAVMYRVINPRS